jgi:nitrogen regulatory protein PII
MTRIKKSKLITAILPKGVSLNVVSRLKEEKGVVTANFVYARGFGKMTAERVRSAGEEREREILSVVVDEERGEEIYEYVYDAADMNKPHGGFMFMSAMSSSEYVLPENI